MSDHSFFRNAVLIGIVLMFAQHAVGQIRLNSEGKAVMDTVRTVDTTSARVLYDRAKEWMLRNLKSSDSHVSLDDEAKTKLIGTENLLLPTKKGWVNTTDRVLNFKLSIFLKDGRYRAIVENMVYSYVIVSGAERRPHTETLEESLTWARQKKNEGKAEKRVEKVMEDVKELEGAINDLLRSLHSAMTATGSSNEGW